MITVGKLDFDELEDAEDYFEQQFFEIKQQLQAKPLLRATAKQRIKQLEELQLFEGVIDLPHFQTDFPIPAFSELSIDEAWERYSGSLSKWKLKCANATTPTELMQLIECGFHLQKAFYVLIPEIDWKEEDPKVGAMEHLMNLQTGFNLIKSLGLLAFDDLSKVPFAEIKENETLHLFFLELKRLSLRSQYV